MVASTPVSNTGVTECMSGDAFFVYAGNLAVDAGEETDSGRRAVLAGEWADTAPALEIDTGQLIARASVMNQIPWWVLIDPAAQRWLVSTSRITALRAAKEWGASASSLSQVPPGSIFLVDATQGPRIEQATSWDPARIATAEPVTDPEVAGPLVIDSLRRAIAAATIEERRRAEPVAVLLSAGIDSGTTLTMANELGLNVRAYSVGTPWGDEHAGAGELCAHLGVPHERVDLSLDEILAAIPEVVFWLGHAEAEKVDIALIASALLRAGVLRETVVLTGYGSDLINLGLPGPSPWTDLDRLQAETFAGVEDARSSGELSGLHYLGRGIRLVHPYWHPEVVATCLAVAPAAKLFRGREKGHLRAAMEGKVPDSVAWREKVAVHHGGGLQEGINAHFGGEDSKRAHYERVLADLITTLA